MARRSEEHTRVPRGQARERIVTAAVKAFADKGFDAASTREIAQGAGVDQGLLTYHFPSKDLLWRAAADRIFGVLEKRLLERFSAPLQGSPRERSRAAIREYVRLMAAHPEFFRFMLDGGHRADARTRWLVDTHLQPRFAFMQEFGVARVRALAEDEVPHAFYALAGAASFIFAVAPSCKRLTGLDPRRKQAIEAHADFVAKLMVP
jgi:TetR/AcrR family transcriptional regulator